MPTKDQIKELHDCRSLVRDILSDSPHCRNSDKLLCFKVWQRQGITLSISENSISCRYVANGVDTEGLTELYNPESIIRVRAEIQNKNGEFLPTDPQILICRKFKESEIRKYYGEGNMVLSEWQNLRYGVR